MVVFQKLYKIAYFLEYRPKNILFFTLRFLWNTRNHRHTTMSKLGNVGTPWFVSSGAGAEIKFPDIRR